MHTLTKAGLDRWGIDKFGSAVAQEAYYFMLCWPVHLTASFFIICLLFLSRFSGSVESLLLTSCLCFCISAPLSVSLVKNKLDPESLGIILLGPFLLEFFPDQVWMCLVINFTSVVCAHTQSSLYTCVDFALTSINICNLNLTSQIHIQLYTLAVHVTPEPQMVLFHRVDIFLCSHNGKMSS